jgi:Gpi18-like mannosyltransferase
MDQRPVWQDFARLSLKIYLPLRLGISAFVALLVALVPTLALPLYTEPMTRWNIPAPTGRLADLFLTPWLRFDALWYLKTALNGYELNEPNIQHMPLYPGLIRLLYEIIGGHIALSALIVSNVAFTMALGYFYRLVRLDDDDATAWRATVYMAIFPTAFFFLVGYTESLLLLGAVGAFYYARQDNWLKAGLMGTICALARPQGFVILLPLALEFWRQHRDIWRQEWPKTLPLLLIPLSVALYALYWEMTFGLQAGLDAYQSYWRIQPGVGIPGQAIWLNISAVVQGVHPVNNGIDLAFTLFGLAMTIWAIRTLQAPYWLFMVLNVLVVISRSISEYPLLSMPRFVLTLFPLYILLARASQTSARTNRLIVYPSLALLLFFSAQFALGGWVA